jgi:hypothetical protein
MTTVAALDRHASRAVGIVRSHATTSRWPHALVLLAALALGVGLAVVDAAPVGVQKDDSMYVILAKSLATGHGYRFLNLPGTPAATHFPPGYPVLLAALWLLAPQFPANLMLFKAVNALFLAIAAVGTAIFARRQLPASWALAAGVLSAISVPLLVLSSMLLSELCFLALLMLLLPALESYVDHPPCAGSRRRAAVLGVAIGVGLLVRTHAIVLIPAVALMLLRRRRWKDAAMVGAVAVACLLPWQLWSARHAGALPAPLLGEYDSYLSWWVRGYRILGPAMLPATLRNTLEDTLGMFAALFSPLRGTIAHAVALCALAVVAGSGLAAGWRRMPVTILFLAGYLAIVAIWPFPPSRFVWGVWPLVLVILLAGARSLVQRLRLHVADGTHSWRAVVGAFAVTWIACGYGAYEYRAVRGQWWSSISRANARRILPTVQWTLANTGPRDLVATEDDGAIYLYTGRPTIPVRTFTVAQYLAVASPEQEAQASLIPLLAAFPVHVVIVGSTVTLLQAEWLASRPAPRIAFRDSFAGGAVFTVLHR